MTSAIPKRRPGPSVQQIYASDGNRAPDVLRTESPALGQSTADVSAERYFSKAWHDREVEQIWRRTWQLACRIEEIAHIGDHILYDIVDDSLIVVRTGPDEVRAYVNSCLHRGTRLRDKGGCVKTLRCPFHGFTWSLAGKLTTIPGAWDFEHIDRDNFDLPEARVGIWGRICLHQL